MKTKITGGAGTCKNSAKTHNPIKARKHTRILLCAFGTVTVLYLGGVFAQLYINYHVWQKGGGITGEALMHRASFNPLVCFAKTFTVPGLLSCAMVAVIAAAIFLYIKLSDKFTSKNFDERNFKRSDRGTYGTAGWMNEKEMREVFELTVPEKAQGTILGLHNYNVVCQPIDSKLNKHIAVLGASGTMKSRAVIRNYMFQSIKRGESVVVTDPKSELFSDTAKLFEKYGYDVKVFNLVTPEYGDSWNCMAGMDGDTLLAQVLTDVIIANTSGEKGDHFWDNGEGNLLKALVLYVDQDPTRGSDEKNLPAVYNLLVSNDEKRLTQMFSRLPLDHPAKAPFNLFAQSSDTVKTGIVLGLGTRLQVFQNEAVRKITSYSDIDLTEPGKRKCAYFVILSDQDGALDFLSSLFFSFIFIKLVRYADSTPEMRCKIPVNMVFDEINNVGTIPDYPRRLSTIRSRAIQNVFAAQNIAQLRNRYPNDQWQELLGNCDTQLMLGCTDELTATFVSNRSGDMSVEVNSTMTTRKTIAVAQVIPEYRHTEGLGRRKLMTPDEVLRLPHDEMLVTLRGQKMLKLKKLDFTCHPLSREMIPMKIQDYKPVQRQVSYYKPAPLPAEDKAKKQKKKAPTSLYSSSAPPEGF